MGTPGRSGASSPDPSGRDRAWRPSLGYLAIAIGLAAGCLAYLLVPNESTTIPPRDAANSATPAVSVGGGVTPAVPVQPAAALVQAVPTSPPQAPQGDADPTRDLSHYVMRGEKPTMPEVIERLHQANVHTGLGAFSPPGTRPPMIGLAVPEDFVLPPGYVRHHQATDDGQRIEAILMFAPDVQLFDAEKKPIEIPKNRVVPPELAPPGLPLRRIVIPAPVETGR